MLLYASEMILSASEMILVASEMILEPFYIFLKNSKKNDLQLTLYQNFIVDRTLQLSYHFDHS